MARKKTGLTGKSAKDALIPIALLEARKGLCLNFKDVVRALDEQGFDAAPLTLYATARERDAIECCVPRNTQDPLSKGQELSTVALFSEGDRRFVTAR